MGEVIAGVVTAWALVFLDRHAEGLARSLNRLVLRAICVGLSPSSRAACRLELGNDLEQLLFEDIKRESRRMAAIYAYWRAGRVLIHAVELRRDYTQIAGPESSEKPLPHVAFYRRPKAVLVVSGAATTLVALFGWSGLASLEPIGIVMAPETHPGIVVGVALLFAAARLDYRRLRSLALPIGATSIALLVVNVATSGWGVFNGSEYFAALGMLTYVAAWLAARGETVRSLELGLIPFVMIVGSNTVLLLLGEHYELAVPALFGATLMFGRAGASREQLAAFATTGFVSAAILVLLSGQTPDGLANGAVAGMAAVSHVGRLSLTLHIAGLGMCVLATVAAWRAAGASRTDFGMLLLSGLAANALLGAITESYRTVVGLPTLGNPAGEYRSASLLLAVGVLVAVARYFVEAQRRALRHAPH